jgi:hypothetical protein
VVITLYSGPFGALVYALSCREPMPGTHEQFVAVKWRQVVGSRTPSRAMKIADSPAQWWY